MQNDPNVEWYVLPYGSDVIRLFASSDMLARFLREVRGARVVTFERPSA